MIPVSKPFLPPLEEYHSMLNGIWKRQWLTNMGPLANDLELKLKEYLDVSHLLYVTNGTIAIQMAIKALELKGNIITTPFSFVATTSSIVWEGCEPNFVDIDYETLNIDVTKIEEAINNQTTAILATHVYGNPCNIKEIEKLATKYKLRVIYDAAHAFGVKIYGRSIFEFGDISTCSLHATKLYHSIEGGLIISKNPLFIKKMAFIRNFGFSGPESFSELGINGKNSEFHAGMGLVNLKYINEIFIKRKTLYERYMKHLQINKIRFPKWNDQSANNFAYFPIIFESEEVLLKIVKELKLREIFARRYFYPSLSTSLPYLPSLKLEVTELLSRKVLCLPLYYDLSLEEVDLICRLILRVINN